MDTCAPGQYTFGRTFPGAGLSVYAITLPLIYPTCPPGRVAYLTVHAAVKEMKLGGTCSGPVAT